ncbi:MAG TPA: DUF4249 family protein [Bacteroidales bacterium]|nr:DUF4249 family protein [Bacteroidales bacterium]
MSKRLLWIGMILLASGCVKQVDWPVKKFSGNLLVVDGILTNEVKQQSVILTLPVSQLNENPGAATGATVVVSNEDSTYQLTEQPANSGIYVTSKTFTAYPDKNYNLLIYYQGQTFTAKARMEPGAYFQQLSYKKNEGNDLYHVDYVASAFTTGEPAMWELLLDWSSVPGYDTLDPSQTRARMLFYTLRTLDVSEIFAPAVEQVSFPAGTIIEERRYSLTAAHAEYIRTLLLETTWQGGLFSSSSSNVATNLSAGATGFFGVCAVTSLSITVTP